MIPPAMAQRAVEMVKSGMSYLAVARELGVCEDTVRRRCRENGIRKKSGRPFCVFSSGKLKQALQMVRDGVSFYQAARHFGADHTTLMYHAHRYGVKSVYKFNGGRPIKVKKDEVLPVPENHEEKIVPLPAPVVKVFPKPKLTKYDILILEPTRAGKTYKEYLSDYKKRTQKQFV